MKRVATVIAALAVTAGATGAAIDATPVGAAGPSVKVSPAVNVARTGKTFVINGSGFNATANNNLGVYVAFGPAPALHPSDWFKTIEHYQAAVWVHIGGTGTATNKPMNANGTFSFTLTNGDGSPIQPAFGSTDCTKIQCGVVTMAAHGSTNRTQDTFRPVIYNTPDPTKAKVGVPYADRVKGPDGGVNPIRFVKRSGNIPKGLTLDAVSGVISGTPTTEGVFKPVIEATDSSSTALKVTRTLIIKVAPKAMVIRPATLPSGTKNVAYSRSLTATGGASPYVFKVKSGALPPGLTLSKSGVISGTPTQRGTFTFVAHVTDKLTFITTRTITLAIL